MSTQTFSRLIVAIAAVAILITLLFSGPTTSAAKADRSAPTTPTNLMVTGITDSTVTLKWNPSTDNSGKFSYQIKINRINSSYNYSSSATVSQSQTTYTVTYLLQNSSYTFAVYAVDGSGNRSSDSNVVNANTPGDTTPPSAPSLQATALGPSQVQLTWTRSTDNVPNNCCSYSFSLNGSPLTQNINNAAAPSGYMSVIIRHLSPGTTNSFTVTAIDYTGKNGSTSNVASAQTWPSNDSTPPSVPTNLHLISADSGEVWLGWTQSTDDTDAQSNIEYEIYVNGVLSPLPVSAGVDFDFVYALPPCENTFTIKAVDKTGNSSAASNPVILKQWVCS